MSQREEWASLNWLHNLLPPEWPYVLPRTFPSHTWIDSYFVPECWVRPRILASIRRFLGGRTDRDWLVAVSFLWFENIWNCYLSWNCSAQLKYNRHNFTIKSFLPFYRPRSLGHFLLNLRFRNFTNSLFFFHPWTWTFRARLVIFYFYVVES